MDAQSALELTPDQKNIAIGIYSRIAHNLVMYQLTDRQEYGNMFFNQCAQVLVQYNVPDNVAKYIINNAMAAAKQELEHATSVMQVKSYGGTEVTPDALIGAFCEMLAD